MNAVIRLGVASLAMFTVASAQAIVDVPLPMGTPAFAPVIFADDDSVSTVTDPPNAVIHCWGQVPAAPTLVTVPLSGPQAMLSPWYRVDSTTAAYDTASGFLAIVRGLPDAASVTMTSIPNGVRLHGVNPTTAVALQSGGFQVVRHGGGNPTVTFVPSPVALNLQAGIGSGRISGDAFVAMGVGADGVPGTPDDALVRIDGLASTNPLSTVVTTVARSAPWAPQGFVVPESGAGFVWRSPALQNFEVEVLDLSGVQPSTLLSLTVPVWAGFGLGGSYEPSAVPLPSNGVLLFHPDDDGGGYGLIRELDGVPTVASTWILSPQFFFNRVVPDDRTVISYEFVNSVGFSYTRWNQMGIAGSANVGEPCWSNPPQLVAPNGQVVIAFSDGTACSSPMTNSGAVLTVSRITAGGPVNQVLEFPGESWTRATSPPFPFSRFQIFAMGSNRVAGFASTNGGGSPNVLRVCTLSSAISDEAPGRRFGPSQVAVTLSPETPTLASPLTLSVAAPAGTDPNALLGLSLARGRRSYTAAQDAVLHLDLSSLLPLVPLVLAPGSGGVMEGSLTIPGGLPPALAGMTHYAQVASTVNGALALSDLMVVTYSP